MWSASGGFTGISRDAEICPGFPPPQGALRIILSNEGDEIDCRIYVLSNNCKYNRKAPERFPSTSIFKQVLN